MPRMNHFSKRGTHNNYVDDRMLDNFHFNHHMTDAITSRPPKKKRKGRVFTTFSAACKNKNHRNCFALKCECECHVGNIK